MSRPRTRLACSRAARPEQCRSRGCGHATRAGRSGVRGGRGARRGSGAVPRRRRGAWSAAGRSRPSTRRGRRGVAGRHGEREHHHVVSLHRAAVQVDVGGELARGQREGVDAQEFLDRVGDDGRVRGDARPVGVVPGQVPEGIGQLGGDGVEACEEQQDAQLHSSSSVTGRPSMVKAVAALMRSSRGCVRRSWISSVKQAITAAIASARPAPDGGGCRMAYSQARNSPAVRRAGPPVPGKSWWGTGVRSR